VSKLTNDPGTEGRGRDGRAATRTALARGTEDQPRATLAKGSGAGPGLITTPLTLPKVPPVPILKKCFAPGDLLPNDLASRLGQMVEPIIQADYCKLKGGCLPSTDYFDMGGALAPYSDFLTLNNPHLVPRLPQMLRVLRTMKGGARVPDIITDTPTRTEFYEIKPASVASTAEGRRKVLNLQAFYPTFGMPYVPGTQYSPTPELRLGGVHKVEFLVESRLAEPGLILYQVCVRGPATELVLPLVIAALLALLAGRAGFRIVPGPGPIPPPIPVTP
jgi:hypothetical protein